MGGGNYLIENARAADYAEPTSAGSAFSGSPVSFKTLNPETFTLPQYLGHIQDSWATPVIARSAEGATKQSQPTIIHIQDAHCNYGCQHKVADIIEYLNEEYGVQSVNLEGGKGVYDLSSFTRIEDKKVRKNVSDYFVKEGLVNGAEYFAINNPDKVNLWGIEDSKLYIENLQIYRESLKNKEAADKYLGELTHMLDNLKRHIYSKELFELDEKYTLYKAEELEFKDYLTYLVAKANGWAIDIKNLTNVYLLNQSLNLEGEIDFKKANDERGMLIGALNKKLSRKDMEELVEKTIAFKTERIPAKEFYAYLVEKAKFINFDLESLPNLNKYIIYISFYDAIDKAKIQEEIAILEEKIKDSLYENETQKELNTLSKNLALVKNIFNISISKDDYEYYLQNKDAFSILNYMRFIKKQAPLYRIRAKLSRNIDALDAYRDNFTRFYECSFKRDEAFLENIKRGQVSSGDYTPYGNLSPSKRATILVTGGFHTENLAELFRENNISYVSIIPNFKNGKEYKCPYFRLLDGKPNAAVSNIEAIAGNSLAIASVLSDSELKEKAHGNNIDVIVDLLRQWQIAKSKNMGLIIVDGKLGAIGVNGNRVTPVESNRENFVVATPLKQITESTVAVSAPRPVSVEPGRPAGAGETEKSKAGFTRDSVLYSIAGFGAIDSLFMFVLGRFGHMSIQGALLVSTMASALIVITSLIIYLGYTYQKANTYRRKVLGFALMKLGVLAFFIGITHIPTGFAYQSLAPSVAPSAITVEQPTETGIELREEQAEEEIYINSKTGAKVSEETIAEIVNIVTGENIRELGRAKTEKEFNRIVDFIVWIMINRTASNKRTASGEPEFGGNTLEKVMAHPKAFSCIRDPESPYHEENISKLPRRLRDAANARKVKIRERVEQILRGEVPDPINGGVLYYNPDIVTDPWDMNLLRETVPYRIGGHRIMAYLSSIIIGFFIFSGAALADTPETILHTTGVVSGINWGACLDATAAALAFQLSGILLGLILKRKYNGSSKTYPEQPAAPRSRAEIINALLATWRPIDEPAPSFSGEEVDSWDTSYSVNLEELKPGTIVFFRQSNTQINYYIRKEKDGTITIWTNAQRGCFNGPAGALLERGPAEAPVTLESRKGYYFPYFSYNADTGMILAPSQRYVTEYSYFRVSPAGIALATPAAPHPAVPRLVVPPIVANVHESMRHDEFYHWLKSEVENGRIKKGLPLILFDAHPDTARTTSENPGPAAWVYAALASGLISEVRWVLPEWSKTDGTGWFKEAVARVESLAQELDGRISYCYTNDLPEYTGEVLVSIDYDFFWIDGSEFLGRAIHKAEKNEITKYASEVFSTLRNRTANGSIAALDLSKTGEPWVAADQIDLIEGILKQCLAETPAAPSPAGAEKFIKASYRSRICNLPNRQKFVEDLIEKVQEGNVRVGVVNIQNFKGIFNDKGDLMEKRAAGKVEVFGHLFGDFAIQSIADEIQGALESSLRGEDIKVSVYNDAKSFYIIFENIPQNLEKEKMLSIFKSVFDNMEFKRAVLERIIERTKEELRNYGSTDGFIVDTEKDLRAHFGRSLEKFNTYNGLSELSRAFDSGKEDIDAAVHLAHDILEHAEQAGKFAQIDPAGEALSKVAEEAERQNKSTHKALAGYIRRAKEINETRTGSYDVNTEKIIRDISLCQANNLAGEWELSYGHIRNIYNAGSTYKTLIDNYIKSLASGVDSDIQTARNALMMKKVLYSPSRPVAEKMKRPIFSGSESFKDVINLILKTRPKLDWYGTFRTGGDEFAKLIWNAQTGMLTICEFDANNLGQINFQWGTKIGSWVIEHTLRIIDETEDVRYFTQNAYNFFNNKNKKGSNAEDYSLELTESEHNNILSTMRAMNLDEKKYLQIDGNRYFLKRGPPINAQYEENGRPYEYRAGPTLTAVFLEVDSSLIPINESDRDFSVIRGRLHNKLTSSKLEIKKQLRLERAAIENDENIDFSGITAYMEAEPYQESHLSSFKKIVTHPERQMNAEFILMFPQAAFAAPRPAAPEYPKLYSNGSSTICIHGTISDVSMRDMLCEAVARTHRDWGAESIGNQCYVISRMLGRKNDEIFGQNAAVSTLACDDISARSGISPMEYGRHSVAYIVVDGHHIALDATAKEYLDSTETPADAEILVASTLEELRSKMSAYYGGKNWEIDDWLAEHHFRVTYPPAWGRSYVRNFDWERKDPDQRKRLRQLNMMRQYELNYREALEAIERVGGLSPEITGEYQEDLESMRELLASSAVVRETIVTVLEAYGIDPAVLEAPAPRPAASAPALPVVPKAPPLAARIEGVQARVEIKENTMGQKVFSAEPAFTKDDPWEKWVDIAGEYTKEGFHEFGQQFFEGEPAVINIAISEEMSGKMPATFMGEAIKVRNEIGKRIITFNINGGGKLVINFFFDDKEGNGKKELQSKIKAAKIPKNRIVTFAYQHEDAVRNAEFDNSSYVVYMQGALSDTATPVGTCCTTGLAILNYFDIKERVDENHPKAREALALIAKGIAVMTGNYARADIEKVMAELAELVRQNKLSLSGILLVKIRPIDTREITRFHEREQEVLRAL